MYGNPNMDLEGLADMVNNTTQCKAVPGLKFQFEWRLIRTEPGEQLKEFVSAPFRNCSQEYARQGNPSLIRPLSPPKKVWVPRRHEIPSDTQLSK